MTAVFVMTSCDRIMPAPLFARIRTWQQDDKILKQYNVKMKSDEI